MKKVLLLGIDANITVEQAEAIRERVGRYLPEHEVCVVGHGTFAQEITVPETTGRD